MMMMEGVEEDRVRSGSGQGDEGIEGGRGGADGTGSRTEPTTFGQRDREGEETGVLSSSSGYRPLTEGDKAGVRPSAETLKRPGYEDRPSSSPSSAAFASRVMATRTPHASEQNVYAHQPHHRPRMANAWSSWSSSSSSSASASSALDYSDGPPSSTNPRYRRPEYRVPPAGSGPSLALRQEAIERESTPSHRGMHPHPHPHQQFPAHDDRGFRGRGLPLSRGFFRGRGRGGFQDFPNRRLGPVPTAAVAGHGGPQAQIAESVPVQLGVRADGTPIYSQNRKQIRYSNGPASPPFAARPHHAQSHAGPHAPAFSRPDFRANAFARRDAVFNPNPTSTGRSFQRPSEPNPSRSETREEATASTQEPPLLETGPTVPDSAPATLAVDPEQSVPSMANNTSHLRPSTEIADSSRATDDEEVMFEQMEQSSSSRGFSAPSPTRILDLEPIQEEQVKEEVSALAPELSARPADRDKPPSPPSPPPPSGAGLMPAEIPSRERLQTMSPPRHDSPELKSPERTEASQSSYRPTLDTAVPPSLDDSSIRVDTTRAAATPVLKDLLQPSKQESLLSHPVAPEPDLEQQVLEAAAPLVRPREVAKKELRKGDSFLLGQKPRPSSTIPDLGAYVRQCKRTAPDAHDLEDVYKSNRVLALQVNEEAEIGQCDSHVCTAALHAELYTIQQSERNVQYELIEYLMEKAAAHVKKEKTLKQRYLTLHKQWLAHCNVLDAQASQRRELARQEELANLLQNESLPTPLDEPSTPGSMITGRSSRRNPIVFDYAATDAQFQEVLMLSRLQYDNDPKARARKTAAIVPDMIIDSTERAIAACDIDSIKIDDPVEYYHINTVDPADQWTEDEITLFEATYLLYPKQFGKIASHLPNKTAEQCVLRYYRSKKTSETFMGVVSAKARDGRKKRGTLLKTKAGQDNETSKGSALMADLGRATISKTRPADDHEVQEASVPAKRNLVTVLDPPQVIRGGKKRRKESQESNAPAQRREKNDASNVNPYQINGDKKATVLTEKGAQRPKGLKTSLLDKTKLQKPASKRRLKSPQDLKGFLPNPMTTLHEIREEANDDTSQVQHFTVGQTTTEPGLSVQLSPALGEPPPTESAESALDREENKLSLIPEDGVNGDSAASKNAKKRSTTSSYWTVSERNEFLHLYNVHQKDVAAIAAGMKNKSEIQVRNYLQNNMERLLRESGQSNGDELRADTQDLKTVSSAPAPDMMPRPPIEGASSRNSIRNLLNIAPPAHGKLAGQAASMGPKTGFFHPVGAHVVLSPPLSSFSKGKSPPLMDLSGSAPSDSISILLKEAQALRVPAPTSPRFDTSSEPPPGSGTRRVDLETGDGSETEDEDVEQLGRRMSAGPPVSGRSHSAFASIPQVTNSAMRPFLPPPSSMVSLESASTSRPPSVSPLIGTGDQHPTYFAAQVDHLSDSERDSRTLAYPGSSQLANRLSPSASYQQFGAGRARADLVEQAERGHPYGASYSPSPSLGQGPSSYFSTMPSHYPYSSSRLASIPQPGSKSSTESLSPGIQFGSRAGYGSRGELDHYGFENRLYHGLQPQTSSERGTYTPSDRVPDRRSPA